MSGGGAVPRAARVRFKPRAAAVFGAGYTTSFLYALIIAELRILRNDNHYGKGGSIDAISAK